MKPRFEKVTIVAHCDWSDCWQPARFDVLDWGQIVGKFCPLHADRKILELAGESAASDTIAQIDRILTSRFW